MVFSDYLLTTCMSLSHSKKTRKFVYFQRVIDGSPNGASKRLCGLMRRMINAPEMFVGLRYLRAKKRTRFVSFITLVSLAGVALGVAALLAISSAVVYHSHWILSDPLFVVFTMAALWALEGADEDEAERLSLALARHFQGDRRARLSTEKAIDALSCQPRGHLPGQRDDGVARASAPAQALNRRHLPLSGGGAGDDHGHKQKILARLTRNTRCVPG